MRAGQLRWNLVRMLDAARAIGLYRVEGKPGAGGMGDVYRALGTRVGRTVALKFLPETVAHDDGWRRRFEQEARLAAALNHLNIMLVYDVGLDQHPPYIVAGLVPNESLRALLQRGPMPARKGRRCCGADRGRTCGGTRGGHCAP
jgi:serine/threonine protein kinase